MAVQKQKIYLETSVISAYFDFWNKSPEQKKTTRSFWKAVKPDYECYISDVVVAELVASANEEIVSFLKFIKNIKQLKSEKKVKSLTQKYIKAEVVPKSKIADANHLAVATIYRIDFLVSWNNKHITRPFKRKQITEFNKKHNLFIPIILTPTDFMDTLE